MPTQQPEGALPEYPKATTIDTEINPARVVSEPAEDATHTAGETQQYNKGQDSGSRCVVVLWTGFVVTLLVLGLQVVALVVKVQGNFFAFSQFYISMWVNGAFAGAAVIACRRYSAGQTVSESDGTTPEDETQRDQKSCSCCCMVTLWVGFVVTIAFFVLQCWMLMNVFYNMGPVEGPRRGWSAEQWLMEIVEYLWGVVLCMWMNGASAGALAATSCRNY
eukprot:COSAG02_NODE_1079_length_14711_cov_86.326512_3_plen_220_part_00